MMQGPKGLISRDGTVLVIIDVQEKLFPFIYEKERVVDNIRKLILFADIVKVPVILTEQYPEGLGETIPEIKRLLPNIKPIRKIEFSCFGSEDFRRELRRVNAKSIILTGIEAHVCISQTALEGLSEYDMYVVCDAVSSRNPEDKAVSLERLRFNGVTIISTEMLIYEVLRRAGTEEFRRALRIIKGEGTPEKT